ncbi:MAG: glycosyltransferase [Planctomycetales bacterium]|nr:glycosyltransferase [Planctomycetales bacterium]
MKRELRLPDDRGPLRVMFVLTSMPVGGAETLLVNLIRGLDSSRFHAEVCCLKQPGPLGEELSAEFPVHSGLLSGKYDVRVLGRLTRLFRDRQSDAVVTVGAGDKMFWGRLAARRMKLPVVISALHSTGWPDSIGRLNRCLTSVTDAFVGVAQAHGQHLVEREGFPTEKVCVIPNGIDVQRFVPPDETKSSLRRRLGLPPEPPLIGIVAALRPEKNHVVFLRAAAHALRHSTNSQFIVVGDGPERVSLETLAGELGIVDRVHFVGTRSDIDRILAACDVFALTSDNEAAPVSILEAMATGLPVVATRVGSVAEMVHHGRSGLLAEPRAVEQIGDHFATLLSQQALRLEYGQVGREWVVQHGSLEQMVAGYERLIERIYSTKVGQVSTPTLASPGISEPLSTSPR